MSGAPLGIIAGSGSLPVELAEGCVRQGRPVFVLGFENATDMQPYAQLPHAQVRLGAIGEAIALLRQQGVEELVLAGAIKRPSWSGLRPDPVGAKLMARLGMKLFAGDDALLKALMNFMQEEGFRVLSAEAVLSHLVAPGGVLGQVAPGAQAEADIAHGITVARTLGRLDIGQAVVVEFGYVLGVEAAEGTDALIQRCGALKREPGGGVLVKIRKPAQDTRADLPSIGTETLEQLHAAGFAGVAVEAGGALLLNRSELVSRADALGLFVVGVEADDQ